MKLTGDSLVVGVVGGIVAGFSLGLGFYLAQKVVHSRALGKVKSEAKDVAEKVIGMGDRSGSYIEQEAMNFSAYGGNQMPQRRKPLNDFNMASTSGNFDFTTGQSW